MTVYTPSELPTEQPLPAAPNPTGKVRTMTIVQRLRGASGNLVLTVEVYEKLPNRRPAVDLYDVQRTQADYGMAFLWQGLSVKRASRYVVNLAEEGGGEHPAVCECRGFEAGHKCRHIAGSLSLLERGEI